MGISGRGAARRAPPAVERFERDVASVPGVTHLILLEGVNDICRSTLPGEPALATEHLVAGYRRIIEAAHARDIRVIGRTITPRMGWKAFTPEMEQLRQQVNQCTCKDGAFDAVIDFEAAIRDDAAPPGVKCNYDSGDRLHSSDNSYEAMGRIIPLSLFKPFL